MRKVLFRRPENARRTVPAFVLSETEQAALLFVPCHFDMRPHCIVVAVDNDGEGIYEVSETGMFHVQAKGVAEIAAGLNAVGKEVG